MTLPNFVEGAGDGRRAQETVPILQHVEESRLRAVAVAREHADQFVGWNRVDVILQMLVVFHSDLLLLFGESAQHFSDSFDTIGRPLVTDFVFVIFSDSPIVRRRKPSICRIEGARELIEGNKSAPFMLIVAC